MIKKLSKIFLVVLFSHIITYIALPYCFTGLYNRITNQNYSTKNPYITSSLQNAYVSLYTYNSLTTAKYIKFFSISAEIIIITGSLFFPPLLLCEFPVVMINAFLKTKGSNFLVQNFPSFYYSALEEIDRLETFISTNKTTNPSLSKYFDFEKKLLQGELEVNKLEIFKEYAMVQCKNEARIFKDVKSLNEFIEVYPDYFKILDQMIKEPKSRTKNAQVVSYEEYTKRYKQLELSGLFL